MRKLIKAVKAFVDFYRPWSWTLARHALWNLCAFTGILALIAYVATIHPYLIVPTILFFGCTFSLLYKFEQGFRIRRMEKGLY